MDSTPDFTSPGHTRVGTCSKCQGPVTLPQIWFATVPPVPTCQKCGAVKKAPEEKPWAMFPIIEME